MAAPTKSTRARKSTGTRRQPKQKPAVNLGRFDGHDVLGTNVAVTNAGDGLSKAMAVEPMEMHLDETVFVVLECKVAKVRFDPIKDTTGVQRVHVLRAGRATMIDGDVVKDALEQQDIAIEEAHGVKRLPLGATDTDGADADD